MSDVSRERKYAVITGQLRYSGGVLQGNMDFDGAAEIEIQLTGRPGLFVSGNALISNILL
jgi:hypothetical protein